jgi:hypothetical protein
MIKAGILDPTKVVRTALLRNPTRQGGVSFCPGWMPDCSPLRTERQLRTSNDAYLNCEDGGLYFLSTTLHPIVIAGFTGK